MNLNQIKRPSLLIDEQKCRRNIKTMSLKARNSGVIFRPHFKTHQSITIGEWFREEGVNCITVSSCVMADHFAANGWQDITIAFPFNIRESGELRDLTEKCRINILVTSQEQAEQICKEAFPEIGCFIKINTGYNRSGIDWNDNSNITRIVELLNNSDTIRIKGFLTHTGHTYKTSSPVEIIDIYNDTLNKLNSIKTAFSSPDLQFSMGDTPSCSVVDNFAGFDEIRPGNFVFYDLTQHILGSCNPDQIAVAVACPVVEKNLSRREIVIYGGGVHLSKEHLKLQDGRVVYGKAVMLTDSGWDFMAGDNYVRSLSQEHGIIEASDEMFRSLKTGGVVGIIPVHSCMTADLLQKYHKLDGNIIEDFSPK